MVTRRPYQPAAALRGGQEYRPGRRREWDPGCGGLGSERCRNNWRLEAAGEDGTFGTGDLGEIAYQLRVRYEDTAKTLVNFEILDGPLGEGIIGSRPTAFCAMKSGTR